MKRENLLIKNTLIISIGKICTQLITFFLLPLYTGVLSTHEFGIVDLLNTLVSLLLPIITFKIEEAIFREMVENRDNKQNEKKIVSNGLCALLIQIIVFLILFIIAYQFIQNDYKIFLATNVIAYAFSSVFLQISRGFGDNVKYSIGSFISALFTIIFNVFFIVGLKLGAQGMLLGTLLGQITCTFFLFLGLKIHNYLDFKLVSLNKIKDLLKYSIPLVPNAISWWIFNASDRVIVSTFLGIAKNGILAACSKFSSAYVTVYYIFHTSWTESVMMHFKDDDFEEYFNKMFNTIIAFFASLAIGIVACMPFVFPIMINSNYSEGYNLIPILMMGALFNAVVALMSSIYLANKNTKTIANISFISALINIITHFALLNSCRFICCCNINIYCLF